MKDNISNSPNFNFSRRFFQVVLEMFKSFCIKTLPSKSFSKAHDRKKHRKLLIAINFHVSSIFIHDSSRAKLQFQEKIVISSQ